MGGSQSTPKSTTDTQSTPTTITPITACAPCLSSSPNELLHLVLAFFAGILLTLLLMALVFLIVKSYRKCHSSPHAMDVHSEPLTQFPFIPEEAHTSTSMTSKILEEKSYHLTANHPTNSDSIVYAQIKVTNPPSTYNKA